MNFSSKINFAEIKPQIYNYLGYKGVHAGSDALISECLNVLDDIGHFAALHKFYTEPPEFLQKQPYASFLSGCSAVALSVTTLGAEVDRCILRLSRTDMAKSVVLDAAASALLEKLSGEYEKSFPEVRTYRFCPGYGGSSVTDLKYVFELLRPEKIGVTLNESCLMLPLKTMAGVIGIGKSAEKDCGNCIMITHCKYLKEGARCYGSENK